MLIPSLPVIEQELSIPELMQMLPVTIGEEAIRYYLERNNVELTENGNLPPKSSQLVLNFFHAPSNGTAVKTFPKLAYESPDGKIKIYREDALSLLSQLPSNSVDLIITDPAYSGMNQHLQLGRGKIIGKYSEKGDGGKWFEEFHDTEENYTAFLQECYRVLKQNRHIYIMFDSYSMLSLAPLVRQVFDVKNVLVWDKQHIGLGHYFRRRHEFIVFASKGKRPLSLKSIPDVWRIKRVTRLKYPTQKPSELFETMLIASAEKDFVVCDPFLGSGSSAIASIKRGCSFIGGDIAQSAIETTTNRIKCYLQDNVDVLQPQSLVEDDHMLKILKNG